MLHARNANVTQAPARRTVLYGAWSVGKDSWRKESFPTDSRAGDFRAGNLSYPCSPPSYRIEEGLWISGGPATRREKRGNLPTVGQCDVARFERNERNKRNEPWPGPRVGIERRNKRRKISSGMARSVEKNSQLGILPNATGSRDHLSRARRVGRWPGHQNSPWRSSG